MYEEIPLDDPDETNQGVRCAPMPVRKMIIMTV